MTSLVNELDNYISKQVGENGHAEYTFSNNTQEKIVQFSFQLTRTNNNNNLQSILDGLLVNLKYHSDNKLYLRILYKMIGQTRDIISGKGEYNLTYMMIYTWYFHFPELSFFALKCLVDLGDNIHQYGSWKDIKYFCKYCRDKGLSIEHPLMQYSVKLINKQLKVDYNNFLSNKTNLSLLAKWVPREKSSFYWMYDELATKYFSNYIKTAKTTGSYENAILKCKTDYRKLLSQLNTYLDTLQIKQCKNTWASINFNNVTSISLAKQKKAFLNIKKDNKPKYPDNKDRNVCSENFKTHIKKSVQEEIKIKGKRVGMETFTAQALELLHSNSNDENNEYIKLQIDLLNSQWKNNSQQTGTLNKIIPMVDVSGSMDGEPLHAAIALGIRVAKKSLIGKRVMTFSIEPNWVNLDDTQDFVSMVDVISRSNWGMNTDFYKALDLILTCIVEKKLLPEEVEGMVLVIFSDMQIDHADENHLTFYESISEKYRIAGLGTHGKPFNPPHILFWNLRSTTGFPTLSTQKNTSMMSGFSPSLLDLFCDKGIEALKDCTPWSNLIESLKNERYKIMENKFNELFC
jgi:hypothetical protein